jgi:CO dehydrogenase maturation factor
MDAMLVVLEPRMKSVDTAKRIQKMASDIQVNELLAVGNKVTREAEKKFIRENMENLGIPVLSYIPYDVNVADADMRGIPVIDYDESSPAVMAVKELEGYLLDKFNL